MEIPHPTPEQVTQSLPDYVEAQEIGRGGFKTVFRAKHKGNFEVVKLIGLPKEGLTDEMKLFRDECLGRAMRETRILGECKSPLIVKLGKLEPHKLENKMGSCRYVYNWHMTGDDGLAQLSMIL